jgi:hypothetical protein
MKLYPCSLSKPISVFGLVVSIFTSFPTYSALAGGGPTDTISPAGSTNQSGNVPITTNSNTSNPGTGSSSAPLSGTTTPTIYSSTPSGYPNNGSSTVLGNNNLTIGTYNNTTGLNNVQCGFTAFGTVSGQTQSIFANPQTTQTNLVGQVGVSYSQQKCTNVNKGIKEQEYGASVRNAMNNNSVENAERVKACTTLLLNKVVPPSGFCERLPTHELLDAQKR